MLTGLFAGLCNGLFGGGGGMIVVPMLTNLLKKEPKVSHATALLIILPLCLVSSVLYSSFANVETDMLIAVSVGVTVGGVIGAFLLKKLSTKWVVIIFSFLMFVAGAKMLIL